MKGIFINMILDPFEAIQADSFWYIIAFENFKRYFLRLLIHRQLHNFSGRRSWVLTLISMHPDVPMSLRLWVVTLWKPRTDLVVSHSLHLGSSCHLSKTAVCLYCGNLWPKHLDSTVHQLYWRNRSAIISTKARVSNTNNKRPKGQERIRQLETYNSTKHTILNNLHNIGS